MARAVEAHRALGGVDLEALGVAVDDEGRERVLRAAVVRGDDEQEVVGAVGEGDEVLLAAEPPAVAVADGAGVQVPPGPAGLLGQAERQHVLAGGEAPDDVPLGLVAEPGERPPDAVGQVDEHAARALAHRGRLEVGEVVQEGEAEPAVLLGDGELVGTELRGTRE